MNYIIPLFFDSICLIYLFTVLQDASGFNMFKAEAIPFLRNGCYGWRDFRFKKTGRKEEKVKLGDDILEPLKLIT